MCDLDDTLVPDRGHGSISKMAVMIEPAKLGLKLLRKRGWKIAVVTNQPTEESKRQKLEVDMRRLEKDLRILIGTNQKCLKLLYCPHLPFDGCLCRKPDNGLLIRALKHYQIYSSDAKNTMYGEEHQVWMVGDKWSDRIAGSGVFAKTCIIDPVRFGYYPKGASELPEDCRARPPHLYCRGFYMFAQILASGCLEYFSVGS
jgi:histidinol phosphatase-like enzyme